MTQDELEKNLVSECLKLFTLLKKKNTDYNSDKDDAFANFRLIQNINFGTVEQGFLTRMADKFGRLSGLINSKKLNVEDEDYSDTLRDLAGYCLMLMMYLKSKEDEDDIKSAVEKDKVDSAVARYEQGDLKYDEVWEKEE